MRHRRWRTRRRRRVSICRNCHRRPTPGRLENRSPQTTKRKLSIERRAGVQTVGRSRPNANRPGRGVSVKKAVLLVLISLPALAEEKLRVKVVQEADRIVVRKKTVIDFNDVTVAGELTRPEGSYVLNRNRTRFRSLVRLRDNFNPELQKSADNL